MLGHVVLEDVARGLYLNLRANLSAELTRVAAEMATRDAAFFAAVSEPVPDTLLRLPGEWHLGHYPELTERSEDAFPVLMVGAYNQRSADDADADQYEPVNVRAYVEYWDARENADEINRALWRTATAIQRAALVGGGTLGGLSLPHDRAPDVDVGDVNVRASGRYTDARIFIQGIRIEWRPVVATEWLPDY